VGLTAGASAPEILVQQVIARIKEISGVAVRTMEGVTEDMRFPLPKGLKLDGEEQPERSALHVRAQGADSAKL